jgi:hypothetical protein
MISLGGLAVLIGLAVGVSSMGERVETTLLSLGACVVSMGLLIAATGVFLKARLLQASAGETKPAQRKGRGGCDVCGGLAVVNCKVHQVHLCADCLGQHYDFRSCAYVPSTRRQGAKPGSEKSMAAKGRS